MNVAAVAAFRKVNSSVDADRRRREDEIGRHRELRQLVDELDTLIERCETAHLEGRQRARADLAAAAHDALAHATDVLGMNPVDVDPARTGVRIDTLMDVVWTVQDDAFDQLCPIRGTLPDAGDGPETDEVGQRRGARPVADRSRLRMAS